MKENLSRAELIELLKEEDKIITEEKNRVAQKRAESEALRAEILRMEKEAEEANFVANKLEEEKNANLIQRYASEASIHKTELEQANLEMSDIDRRIAELTDSSKNRINKLANQFVELNKEKNSTLTSIEVQTRNETEEDLKILDKTFRDSLERNQDIINREKEKEEVTQANIDILTKTISLSPTAEEEPEITVEEEVELLDSDEE